MVVIASRPETGRDRAGSGRIQAADAENEREDVLREKGPETALEGRKTQPAKTGAKRAGKTKR